MSANSPSSVFRIASVCLVSAIYSSAFSQTPPLQLKTPDVQLPAPLSFPGSDPSGLGAQPLTVTEAVTIALRKQPQINIARANLLIERGRTQQTASALYPQFGLSGGINAQRTIRSSADSFSSGTGTTQATASADVRQLLFDFGRTRDQVRQQSAVERASLLTFRRTTETVTLDVKLAFYDLMQSRANVLTSESNVANRQRQLDQARARANSGLGAPVDVVQAKTNLADAGLSLSSARNQEIGAQIALAQLLGIDAWTPITPAPSSEPAVSDDSDLKKLVASALANRPDISAAREQVSAARFGLSAARKTNAPSISGAAGVNSRGQVDPFSGQAASIGATVSWPIGDGGFAAGRIKEARGGEQAALASLIQVTNQVTSEVSQAYVDLQSALQRVDLAEVGTENSRELVRVSEGRYSGGLGQFLDITNAQNSLFSTENSLSQAREDVQRARARLRAAAGLP